MKKDITMYGSQELDLIVQNEEYLYNEFMKAVRRNRFKDIFEFLDEIFEFTDEQIEELEESFKAEVEEYEKD